MKKELIVALVCLNVGLLTALLVGPLTEPAKAQVAVGGSNYLVVTGTYRGDDEAVYIIDLRSRRLAAWRFDRTKKNMVGFGARELSRDFGRDR